MRAKRNVIVLVESEQLRSELRVVLQVHGLRVFVCEWLSDALEIAAKLEHAVAICDFAPDALVLKDGGVDASVLLAWTLGEAISSSADRIVYYGDGFFARVVESVKIAAARKRGPRQKTTPSFIPVEVVMPEGGGYFALARSEKEAVEIRNIFEHAIGAKDGQAA